nr:hypothetical protein [Streptomyces sp. NL15-2K]
MHESYGEDQEPAAQFAVAFVHGTQGENGATGVLATANHSAAMAPRKGLNKAVTQLGRSGAA